MKTRCVVDDVANASTDEGGAKVDRFYVAEIMLGEVLVEVVIIVVDLDI